MKIASWNVNSIRQRLNIFENWAKEYKPDIILLQEIKCENEHFPLQYFEDMHYNCVIHGQKSYNGVAIISKYPIDSYINYIPGLENDIQSRYIEAVISIDEIAIRVASIYVPNGRDVNSDHFLYKMSFFDALYNHIQSNILNKNEIVILGGDYNVAPEEIDVYDVKKMQGKIGFHIEERKKIRSIINLGMYDAFREIYPKDNTYSWWDYRAKGWENNRGLRIDNLLLSPEAMNLVSDCKIHKHIRSLPKTSDHVPISCELDLY